MNKIIEYQIENQPIINIGCLGSVSDGKSTLVEKTTGIKTQKHSSEKTRNITIKQGYANMKIWKNDDTFYTSDSNLKEYILHDDTKLDLVNHISFVDCPGHQELIHTMLSSISLMDGAIIVIAVDQPLKTKPQLIQHMAAAKLGKLDKIIICMNKIDLVTKEVLMERKAELDTMLEQYDIKPYAIIPTCFNKKLGINYLLNKIMELFNPSNYLQRTEMKPVFRISRTFDINKPGTDWNDVNGGVIGGSLISGTLKVGDMIEIKPGQLSKDMKGNIISIPIKTKVLSIQTDTSSLDSIIPGGLIGIRTDMDPYYCKNDMLSGNIANTDDSIEIYNDITLDIKLVTTFGANWEPKVKDIVSIQIGTKMSEAKLVAINMKNQLKFQFTKPVCIMKGQNIIICKNIDKILKIVGESILE
jgi:translation initiation factor 2 subunit 3